MAAKSGVVVINIEDENKTNSRLRCILEEGSCSQVRTEARRLPPWFDPDKFKRGQRYFHNNYFCMFVGKLSGLVLVLSVPSILRVLVFTKKSSEPAKAYRRYMDTIANMVDWYDYDIATSDSKSERTLRKVRGQHCAASRKFASAGNSPISQMDMALTQFGFMGICLVKAEYLGFKGSREDVEGFVHFWKTIGYLMGLEDRYNICDGTVEEVVELCEKIRTNVYKPFMESPSSEFSSMSEALLKGVRPIVPFLHPEAFMEFVRILVDLPTDKPLSSLYARVILRIQVYLHTVLLSAWFWTFILKPILNFNMWLTVNLNSKFPFLASLTLGKDVYPEKSESVQSVNPVCNTSFRLVTSH